MVDNEGTCQDVGLVLHFGLIDHVETSLAIVSVSNSREWLGIRVSNPKLLLGSVILAVVVASGLLRVIAIPLVSIVLSSSPWQIVASGCITNSSVAILRHVASSSTSETVVGSRVISAFVSLTTLRAWGWKIRSSSIVLWRVSESSLVPVVSWFVIFSLFLWGFLLRNFFPFQLAHALHSDGSVVHFLKAIELLSSKSFANVRVESKFELLGYRLLGCVRVR